MVCPLEPWATAWKYRRDQFSPFSLKGLAAGPRRAATGGNDWRAGIRNPGHRHGGSADCRRIPAQAGGRVDARRGGVSDRAEVVAARTTLPPLGAGEFYVEDLVGCLAEDREGRSFGVVRGVFWNGGHDVMVIADGDADERLLPAVPEFIVAIDRLAKRVVVDPHE